MKLGLITATLATSAACLPPGSAKPAAYEVELLACNRKSESLAESIACEERVRAAYGRPARDGGAR